MAFKKVRVLIRKGLAVYEFKKKTNVLRGNVQEPAAKVAGGFIAVLADYLDGGVYIPFEGA
jgi:hypothetical protein